MNGGFNTGVQSPLIPGGHTFISGEEQGGAAEEPQFVSTCWSDTVTVTSILSTPAVVNSTVSTVSASPVRYTT